MSEPSRENGKVITSISYKKKKNLYEVSFGLDKLLLSPDTYSDYLLYVGKAVSNKEYREMVRHSKEEKLYAYGVNMAAKGCYSRYEVLNKIKEKAKEDENPLEIMARLSQLGLFDDKRVAIDYKELKESQLYGEERIKDDLLYKKVIDKNIIDELEFLDEEEHASKYLEIWSKSKRSLPLRAKKEKGYQTLRQRGYSDETTRVALTSLDEDSDGVKSSLKKEYAKALNSYSKRYEGYELSHKIYGRLLSKGYKKEDIKEVMEDIYG